MRGPLLIDAAKRDLKSMTEWGRQKMLDGDFEAAAQHFTVALELKPGLITALVSRGVCYLSLGDEERAQRDFAAVISRDAGFNRNVYVLIALCCKRSGNFRSAVRYLSHCISQFPSFKPALLGRGELYLKLQDFERARADFRSVLQLEPTHLVARRGFGDTLRALGNSREALKQYSRAIDEATSRLQELELPSRKDDNEELGQLSCSTGLANEQTENTSEYGIEDVVGSEGASRPSPCGSPDGIITSGDEDLVFSPEQLRSILMELLLRRALLHRLVGNLEAAGSDLVEILDQKPQHGLALFWYGKLLLEQQRHREAPSFLLASIEHNESTRAFAHALLGTMLMVRVDPDMKAGLRHLQEAAQLAPGCQSVRVTMWICSAAAALHQMPRDAVTAIGFLDRALGALEGSEERRIQSARGARPKAKAEVVAGSAVAAAAALSARGCRSAEEERWLATRSLVKRQQELAQGSDLEHALGCRTFLQLVYADPRHRAVEIPPLLFRLRVTALCDLCRWEEAVADCNHALAVDPNDDAMQYTLHIASGILRSRNGKFESAVGCFTKAIRLQPVSAEARLHRAIVLACAARAQGQVGSARDGKGIDPGRLLRDAVQDLEAVEQQAMITGASAPIGAAHLRAACLCALGKPDEAWEVLCSNRGLSERRQTDPSLARQRSLEAEVLICLGRHSEALEALTAVLALNPTGHAEALEMRSACWSEVGEEAKAFQDIQEAINLAPDRSDLHEAKGNMSLHHRRYHEALAAYASASKYSKQLQARHIYKQALAQVALGHLGSALRELDRCPRQGSRNAVLRARDGLLALEAAVGGDFRQAHVRLNMMLQCTATSPTLAALQMSMTAPDELPWLFFPHELMTYRGICSLYLGDHSTALQDFAISLELVKQLWAAFEQAPTPSSFALRGRPPAAASAAALAAFECECLSNVVFCHLMARDHAAALACVERLLSCEALKDLPPSSLSLAWFLAGVCQLALGEPSDTKVRESFLRSYSFSPTYVDDFLRRHEKFQREVSRPPSRGPDWRPMPRRFGGPPTAATLALTTPRQATGACDAAPGAVCCLIQSSDGGAEEAEKEASPRLSGHSRLSGWLPPIRLQIQDVVVWCRPCAGWPCVRPPPLQLPETLARLDMLPPCKPST